LFDDIGNKATFKGMEKTLDTIAKGWCRAGTVGGSNIDEAPLDKKRIFPEEAKNSGRLTTMEWAVCAAISAALRSAGILDRGGEKLQAAIYFSSPDASIPADSAYIDDYLAFDETAGRANLFVHTLPSSPLGEASVRFGLTGETIFFADSADVLETMTRAAETAAAIRGKKLFLIGTGRLEKNGSASASFSLMADTRNENQ
jgi:hypothetical protein